MKQDKKTLIIIGEALLIIVLTILLIITNLNKKNKETMTKKEYYNNMTNIMQKYYEIYYKNKPLPDELKEKPIKTKLEALEKYGFPMDSFVSYKTNVECDKTESYAIRTLKEGEYKIEIYFKCGKDSNSGN